MLNSQKDPLLTSGKFLTVAIQVILGIGIAAMAVALPAVMFSYEHVAKAMAENGSTASLSLILILIALVMAISITMLAAGFHFFRLLGRIIDTVKEGEPFNNINADRLNLMGWITVAVQVASIPVTALVAYLSTQFPQEEVQWDVEFSITGILLALILFILARVFRHGTAMRDDLEGTV